MKWKIDDYDGEYRVVSLALNSIVKSDLEKNEDGMLWVDGDEVFLYPEKRKQMVSNDTLTYLKQRNNYDVFEIWQDGRIVLQFDVQSIDNYFFVTGKCNSNCIMCPSPEISRRKGQNTDVTSLIKLAQHVPTNVSHITITGGEPFLIGESIFDFLEFLKRKFEKTEFLFLTNGRIFSVKKYVDLFRETAPVNSIVAIPIHGSKPEIHDAITCAENSLIQTKQGIKNLLKIGTRVEIRLVVCKLNAEDIVNTTDMIVNEFPQIEYVSILAMEMTGNAYVNREKVWIPYRKAFQVIEKAVDHLIKSGITVKLYNFPLCTVESNYWTLCEKSISPEKIRYIETCDMCRMKNACGGLFAGTVKLEKDDLKAIR